MSPEALRPGRGRWQVIALAVMFFGPAILAWALVLSGWQPAGTTNNGTLVEPPVAMAPQGWRLRGGGDVTADRFQGRWTLLAAVAGDCGAACTALLDRLRRVRLALDKDMQRVQIMLVQPRGAATATATATEPEPELADAVAPAAAVRGLAGDAAGGAVHVVDFRGFRMMTYPLPLDASGLLDDLETLLKRANEDIERLQRLEATEGAGA